MEGRGVERKRVQQPFLGDQVGHQCPDRRHLGSSGDAGHRGKRHQMPNLDCTGDGKQRQHHALQDVDRERPSDEISAIYLIG